MNRFAYVFYATDDAYAAGAIIAATALRRTGAGRDIGFVFIYHGVSPAMVTRARHANFILREVEPLRFTRGKYYRDCLTKLRIFQLVEYERVVFIDSDSLPLQNLDHLFTLPFAQTIAAPRAYWTRQFKATSLLLVVTPSMGNWDRVQRHFASAFEKRLYDMNIINLEFDDEIHFLADEYGCLNSEWCSATGPFYFGDAERARRMAMLVHFSHLGKPWFWRPEDAYRLLPTAHPIFHDLWADWWDLRDEILGDVPIVPFAQRMRLLAKLYLGLARQRLSRPEPNRIAPKAAERG
ncbi:MAG: glycosyltransferase [Candidatus Binatus sp.]